MELVHCPEIAICRVKPFENEERTQQINGREGETATLLSRCFVSLCLRVFGFAPRHLKRYVASPMLDVIQMKEISPLELEQFREYLEYREDKTPRNLNPFFDVKMFELESLVSPSVIVLQAFPDAKPEKAEIIERSENEFSGGVVDFFSHLENTNQENQFNIAYEFLEALKSAIKFEHSKIWEYLPDHSSFDRLYDYIGWGFTYIIVEESNRQCLIIHGGYID